MDFGKLQQVDKVDFTLQPEHAFNKTALAGNNGTPKIWVGCPVWANKEWNGKIYPYTAKTADYLNLYSKQFNTIELNVTHYQIPSSDTIEKWRTESADGFTFCPKFPQIISHDKLLQNSEGLTAEFCTRILDLSDKLGMPFLQLAPYFTPRQFSVLEKYLRLLPPNLRIAVEFRHEDWFKNPQTWQNALALLHSYGHGTVITDVAGRRDVVHQSLSNAIATIRWVGNEHPSDYQRIDEWVQKIKCWLQDGLQELYLFVHICENTIAPEMALYWIKQLNLHCGLSIKEPKFLPKVEQMSLF
jgi:uncharacterized protein YecE (DUF72 family)